MLKLSIVLNNHLVFVRNVVKVLNLLKMASLVVKLEEMLSHLQKKPKKIEVKRPLIKRKSSEILND
jgi:hypothetical protein